VQLTRKYQDRFGEDTASAIVEAALDRIINYPHGRPRPAARILRHVDHVLWRAHLRQLRCIPTTNQGLDDEAVEYRPEVSAGEIVVSLVEQAVRGGKLSRERALLVLQHRILSVPTESIADELGYPASTIRQWRSRAEATIGTLALEAVA
jgi:DNA-directed RNA polymerase specialized sigma24 family protein